MMKTNQSKTERLIRIVTGISLLRSANRFSKLGLVPLLTGIMGYCPAKSLWSGCTNKCDKSKDCADSQIDKACSNKNKKDNANIKDDE
ncbi:DUF2892 domain-containing protein [Moraxella nasovis]|uniref:YgaP family membrane protein n=1 Tax=Moraxella nasovis TaxID=2904121 RepID=UPI001F613A18|nr:DUF2892 domain-containing protein [Moraxella nasovis]UNU72877.1 DUF2892 domain-containing protein [Moraxella nasovis]